jgi:hypothetical protein
MKKWSKTIIILLVLLVIGSAITIYRFTVPTIVPGSASMANPIKSLEELEERSAVIAEVTVSGKGKEDENDLPYTYTPVIITKVYKGNVSCGEEIEVREFYRYYRTPIGLYMETIEDYLPMEKNGKYLLFLTETPSGTLSVAGIYYGKFVWPTPSKATRSAKSLEIFATDNDYLDILDAVVDNYGKSK